jgi:hypothetical protein
MNGWSPILDPNRLHAKGVCTVFFEEKFLCTSLWSCCKGEGVIRSEERKRHRGTDEDCRLFKRRVGDPGPTGNG